MFNNNLFENENSTYIYRDTLIYNTIMKIRYIKPWQYLVSGNVIKLNKNVV